MSDTAPILAGLAIGIRFIVLFSALFPSSSNFQLRISQEKAVEIAAHDLTTKYIINPPLIKIYAVADMQSQGAVYPAVGTFLEGNYTLPIAHKAVNGTFYFVDARTRALEECHVPYCTFREEGMEALEGRFAWIVELVTQCEDYPHHGADIKYAIDTKTGHILWRHFSSPEQQEQQEPFVCS